VIGGRGPGFDHLTYSRRPGRAALHVIALLIALLPSVSCGKKGPPLPPLVRLPAAPPDAVASRRGSTVEFQFAVPQANTDGSTPADVTRVDVYGLTGEGLSGDDIVRRGARVGTVLVNPPPDPDEDPDAVKPPDPEAPPKRGIDQGEIGRVAEEIAALSASGARSYVGVGVNKAGRRGPTSPPSTIPLGPAPPAPAAPAITYSETAVDVGWAAQASTDPATTTAIHVYEAGTAPRRLSDKPLPEPPFQDTRIEWGAERCYQLRTVQTANNLTMESEASEPACVTLKDTFPPAAPTGLTAVAASGTVSLIWNASPAKDVAGYLVLKAVAPDVTPVPVTPTPVTETTFRDTAPSGVRVVYAVQAVDQAGNVSPMSDRIEETPR
jgi:hypothetical protein